MVEVVLQNKGTEPVEFVPLWVWNAVPGEGQNLPFPLLVEVLRGGTLETLPDAEWRRRLGVPFGRWQPGSSVFPTTLRLWPGERSVSWVELGWQFELGPGRHVVRWRGPLFGSAGAEQGRFWLSHELELATAPQRTGFAMAEAWGVNREAIRWSDYRVGTRTPPQGDRSAWIASVDPAKVAGSVYARWVDYLVVQCDLAFGGERGEWRRFSPRANEAIQRWLGPAPALNDHPMRARIELLCEVKRLLDAAEADANSWPAIRPRVQSILAQSADQEWAYYLVRFAAWRDVPQPPARFNSQAEYQAAVESCVRLARETPARWGYPWFRLPPDQRPGGAAAKPEP